MSATTVPKLLDTAQRLIQERGFNAFSYKDLAEEVGIRTASIHYHFATKADLGNALVDRYRDELAEALASIDRRGRSQRAKLKSLVEIYRDTEKAGRICLCGSLASDVETLRDDLQDRVHGYLALTEDWVRERIAEGTRAGEFEPLATAKDLASSLVAGLQGGLLVGRARRGSVLDAVQRSFFKSLGA